MTIPTPASAPKLALREERGLPEAPGIPKALGGGAWEEVRRKYWKVKGERVPGPKLPVRMPMPLREEMS